MRRFSSKRFCSQRIFDKKKSTDRADQVATFYRNQITSTARFPGQNARWKTSPARLVDETAIGTRRIDRTVEAELHPRLE